MIMKVSEETNVSCLLGYWAEWMKGGNRDFPNHFVPYQVNIGDLLLAKGDGVCLGLGGGSSAGNEDQWRQKPFPSGPGWTTAHLQY